MRARNDTELFYLAPDVSADGLRFLMLTPVADGDHVAGAPRLVVVQHFAEELMTRVPVNEKVAGLGQFDEKNGVVGRFRETS